MADPLIGGILGAAKLGANIFSILETQDMVKKNRKHEKAMAGEQAKLLETQKEIQGMILAGKLQETREFGAIALDLAKIFGAISIGALGVSLAKAYIARGGR